MPAIPATLRLTGLVSLATFCATKVVNVEPRIASCSGIEWSRPDTVWGPRRTRLYIETPEILVRGDSILLLGSPSFATDSTGALIPSALPLGTSGTSPLFAGARLSLTRPPNRNVAAEIIPLPIGVERMGYLRAASVSGDDVAVVYRDVTPLAGSGSSSHVIWTSVLGRSGWTRPQIAVSAAEKTRWSGSVISVVSHDARGDLLTASAFPKDSTKLLRATARGWAARTIPLDQPSYPSILGPARTDSELTIAYVAATADHPRSGVFIRRSADDGLNWSAPVPASDAGSDAIHHARLLRGGDRELGLVWLEADASGTDSRLHVATSQTLGASWREGPVVALSDVPTDLRAISDDRGHLHVVVDSVSSTGGGVRHLLWDGVRWIRSDPPTPRGFVIPSPTVASLGRDSVIGVWAMTNRQGGLPVTLVSVGRTVCNR